MPDQRTWMEWKDWADESATKELRPLRLQLMHRFYGRKPGKKCGTCALLFYHTANTGKKRYYKCKKSSFTHGPGTDWRMKWEACGLHKEKSNGSTDQVHSSSNHSINILGDRDRHNGDMADDKGTEEGR